MRRGCRTILGASVVLAWSASVAPPLRADEAASADGRKRITLNMPKGDIRQALTLVAEQGGLNLVIGPGVEGDVSVYLADASLESALRAITTGNGFTYSVEEGTDGRKDVISVSKPPERQAGEKVLPPLSTRVFTLRSQDAARVADALKDALTPFGKINVLNINSLAPYRTVGLTELSGEFDTSQTSTTNGTSRTTGGAGGNSMSQTAQLAKSTPPQNAQKLVVTDTPENLELIADLIADLDQLPPQVLIEARIVEMTTDLQRELGIDWNVNVLANGPILNHELPLQFEAGFASGSQIRRSPTGRANASAGLALGTIDFSQLIALLRVHQTDNAIRLLANPRLLVFNNHSASILVGERYPILESTITDFGTVTEAFDTYIPIGVQLEVTPNIMLDGRISLMVHPVTSALGDDVVGTTGLRVARIRTRELSTRVILDDGQTIVLGGLISDRKTRHVNKVPGLGDLPILSIFTRQENPRSERVDLMVFLTAHVDGASEMSERDREVFDTYRPQFKQIQRLQDVQLHFEVPTEYEAPRPMFGDPPAPEDEESGTDVILRRDRTIEDRDEVEADVRNGNRVSEIDVSFAPNPPRAGAAAKPLGRMRLQNGNEPKRESSVRCNARMSLADVSSSGE